jgi:von Willebrand factor A domain-containing protein 5
MNSVPSLKLNVFNIGPRQIFLVDRSGSMHGPSIEQAKKALEYFVHSLPANSYFNIVSFGSRYDSLFGESETYDDSSLAFAKTYVATMEANYGGTEIYQPLEFIFRQPRREGYLRQVFVLTDGEVSNGASVIDLVSMLYNSFPFCR